MNGRGFRLHRPVKSRSRTVALTVIGIAAVSWACKEEVKPPQPPKPPEFSLEEAVGTLSPLGLDDGFFKALDDLEGQATVPGAKPALLDTFLRIQLDGAAASLASGHPAGSRLFGGDPADAATVGRFLARLSDKLTNSDQKDLAGTLSVVGAAYGNGPTRDLGPLFVKAMGNQASSPAVRLLLANRLFTAVTEATAGHEHARTEVIERMLPGFPSPQAQELKTAVFPSALKMLSTLLKKGAGTGGLASYYDTFKANVDKALEGKAMPMPVPLGAEERTDIPLSGVLGNYQPLGVISLINDAMRLGARPFLVWKAGEVADATDSPGWPGETVATVQELADAKGRKSLVEAFTEAFQALEKDLEPLEASAYPDAGRGKAEVGNADQGESGHAILLTVDPRLGSEAFGDVLEVATAAGISDLRLALPGRPDQVFPVFFQKIPEVPDTKVPTTPRALLVVSGKAAELYPPVRKKEWKLPLKGWPDGTRSVEDKKRFFKLVIPWTKGKGYAGAVTRAVSILRDKTQSGPLVDVVVRTRDTSSAPVLDAAAEIEATAGEPWAFDAWFPGVICTEEFPCPAMVPVLFSGTRVPRPSKPETEIKETRPAGFCEKGAVARVMRGRSGAYRACYEMQLQRKPTLAGRIRVRFTIEPNGSVSGVKVTQNQLNAKVASCIVKQISTLKFAKPDGGICVIQWPFKFQPGG